MLNHSKQFNLTKVLFAGIALIAFVATIVVVSPASQNVAAAETTQRVRATLSNPVSLSEFANIARRYGIKPVELHYTLGDIQGGYTVKADESVDEALIKFADAHSTFLSVAIAKTEKEISDAKDEATLQRVSALLNQLQTAQFKTSKGGLKIDSIETDDNQSIKELEKAGFVKDIEPVQKVSDKVSAQLNKALSYVKNTFVAVANASLYHESWAPYGGGSDVNQSYTYQTLYFNNISAYGSADTYEHETQVYDKNFANYAGYWSSNMPSAYYDTPFSDSIDNFTIGTFTGASLQTYTQYYTYMSLSAGSASSATVRIKGQKGHRSPSWCYSTWCVFPDATTGSMATFTAPAGMSWQY